MKCTIEVERKYNGIKKCGIVSFEQKRSEQNRTEEDSYQNIQPAQNKMERRNVL